MIGLDKMNIYQRSLILAGVGHGLIGMYILLTHPILSVVCFLTGLWCGYITYFKKEDLDE